MTQKFAIQYESRSVVNRDGIPIPVGTVYALALGYGGGWSYVTEAKDATLFDSIAEAEGVLRNRKWHAATVVEVR